MGISTPDDFELTTDVLPDALLLLSASGSIVAADSAAQDFFHSEHRVGLSFSELVTDPEPKVTNSLRHGRRVGE